MAMLRQQFNALPIKNLKALIEENLKFIKLIVPFDESRAITEEIGKAVKEIESKDILRERLISLMNIIVYWDRNQDERGLFTNAQKAIVLDMLRAVTQPDSSAAVALKK